MSTKDEPPEFGHWKDEGCELAPACLSCPLTLCKHDRPAKQGAGELHMLQLVSLTLTGRSIDEAAVVMQISRRQVFRLKAQARAAGRWPG